ncbi:unnamed protein product [Lepeophtheirus salmonis]|uniref:(salmon louse) hypothetical protein n=1 Tax=Lepeophtheirus salmonis TaxID=72036 RepID=A0A7R8CC24_LEPSM|nr:unnamed protein product [Lepeophtheirus salmonis]CAF2764914.1 unnamed protein product [Lepeophtheirus salmonis]
MPTDNATSTPRPNWKVFAQKWRNYSIITRLAEQEEQYKVALLQHTLGDELLKVYNGLRLLRMRRNEQKDEASAVNKVRASTSRSRNSSFPKKNSNYNSVRSNDAVVKHCKFCGLTHSMWKLECPAWGKNCNKCKRLNHIEAKCPKSNAIHSVDALANSSDSEMEERHGYTILVDTEASVNIIPLKFASRCHIAPTGCRSNEVGENQQMSDGMGTNGIHYSRILEYPQGTVISPSRRIPVALQPNVKAELDRLVSIGVIEPISEPTPWMSQIVIVEKKSGDMRICLDPHNLNKALKREHYQIPLLEDTLYNMSQSKKFRNFMLNLLIGIVSLMNRQVNSQHFNLHLVAINGDVWHSVSWSADEIVVHGKDVATHDLNLNAFLKRCQERNIKLNRDKLELRFPKITFMGHFIGDSAVEIDPEKSPAIKEMNRPKNLEELRRFLGIVNYLSKFILNLISISAPMRNLLKKAVSYL